MNRRRILRAALAASATLIASQLPAFAQGSFPDRPLKLVVPFPPGGPYDSIGRFYARKMPDMIGQPVVVENRSGGQTSAGALDVARAKPDGYTLLLGGSPSHVFAPVLLPKAPYDALKDFTPLSLTGVETLSIVVRADSAVKTLKDLEKLAKGNAGKLNYGDTAPTAQLALEMFKKQAGNLKIAAVPYRGFAPAINDLIAGHIQVLPSLVGPSIGFYEQKSIRFLGVFSEKRLPSLPDVPTGIESGYPDLVLWTFTMLFTTAGVPKPVLDRLSEATQKVLRDPEFVKFHQARGIQPILDSSPAAARAFLEKQIKTLTPKIHELPRKG